MHLRRSRGERERDRRAFKLAIRALALLLQWPLLSSFDQIGLAWVSSGSSSKETGVSTILATALRQSLLEGGHSAYSSQNQNHYHLKIEDSRLRGSVYRAEGSSSRPSKRANS